MMEFVAAAAPFMSTAASVVSGLMSISQGFQQSDSLRFQADLALLQGQERSLNYKREELNAKRSAMEILDRQRRANSAVIARSAAMGIMPFEGSPLDLQKYNDRESFEEWQIAKENEGLAAMSASNALLSGQMQASEYKSAAKSAKGAGLVKGLMSIGGGLYDYAKLGGAPSTDYGFQTGNLAYMGGGTGITANARGLGMRF